MNNKGYAQIALPAGVVVAIIFIFELWAFGMVYDAIAPELENALLRLEGDKVICPPEFQKSGYEVCFDMNGEVIADGNFKKAIEINLDTGQSCSIKEGNYEYEHLCTLENLWKAEEMYVEGIGFFNKKTIQISKLMSYLKSGKYLKALRLLRYLPK